MINILGFVHIMVAYRVIRWHHHTPRAAFNVARQPLAFETILFNFFLCSFIPYTARYSLDNVQETGL
ncbi:hypothetical protein [Bartonella elizabethae]|uniref:hypothetical protein n=1 Tax=Bartonella elizabethae TaxID=807 RepID=UPI00047E58A5|nr:hypothetical protein [Bartonella elizabethae]